jgi:hypothetical protein
MINKIIKSVENGELTVEVHCKVRNFATQPKKVLTTAQLIDILNKEYSISSILSEPKHEVSNSDRKKSKPKGRWIFAISEKKESKPIQEEIEIKPKPKPKRRTQTKKKETTPDSGPANIRSRISSLSKK